MRPSAKTLLLAAKLPAVLITEPVNVRYLTGFKGDSASVLALPSGFILFADSLEYEAARSQKRKGVRLQTKERGFPEKMATVKQCGFEGWGVTFPMLARWKKQFKNTKFVQTLELVEGFRRNKDAQELKTMDYAHNITKELLRHIPTLLKPGVTERETAWQIETMARSLGADCMSFETIVAFGTHTSRPHHHPTDRKLRKGQLVQIDLGATYHGYCSDRSAVFFTGKPTPREQLVLKALEEALAAGKAAVKAGAPCSAPDKAARKVLTRYKLQRFFTHSVGHGVGLDIHEGVVLHERSKDLLLKNEVVTIEPGVYFPGKFGMRLEEMIIVK